MRPSGPDLEEFALGPDGMPVTNVSPAKMFRAVLTITDVRPMATEFHSANDDCHRSSHRKLLHFCKLHWSSPQNVAHETETEEAREKIIASDAMEGR